MPIMHVQPSDVKDPSHKPINETDQEKYDMYDERLFECAPVAVQLVGRSFQEELLLAVAMAIDRAVKCSA